MGSNSALKQTLPGNQRRHKSEFIFFQSNCQAILDSSPFPPDGQPRGNAVGNPTERKVIDLWSNIGIIALQRSINAVEQTIKELDQTHKDVFEQVYINGRRDIYKLCDELCISEPTLRRKKSNIVMLTGKNLGVIR